MIYLLVPAKVIPFSQDCKALGVAEGYSVIRGFILCVAQFVTQERKTSFLLSIRFALFLYRLKWGVFNHH